MKLKKNNLLSLTLIVGLAIATYYIFNIATGKKNALTNFNTKQVIEVFKTPSCKCCSGYVLFLEKKKFKVKQIDMTSLHTIKKKYNIPLEMQSCHTTIVDKYFIEGHVPLKAIKKLLEDQSDIDGIALPGMPIGTPGMPGDKEQPYVIYQLIDGEFSVFMTI